MIEILEFFTGLTKRLCLHFVTTVSGHAETCVWCGARRTTFVDRAGIDRVSPWRKL